jgi:hypothetical protein
MPGLVLPAHTRPLPKVPYVSTPHDLIEPMLAMGEVRRGDAVYDLGCGDGRIVITAARSRGAGPGAWASTSSQKCKTPAWRERFD